MSNFRDPKTPLTKEQLLLRKQVLYQVESEPGTFDMRDYETISRCGTARFREITENPHYEEA